MIRRFFGSRFRIFSYVAAFLAGVAVTIWSWTFGLVLLVLAGLLDFLSFKLGSR